MPVSPVEKAFCTTSEAAALLGVSVGTVQLWVENGLLDAWKTHGGHRRVVRESINRLLHKAPAAMAAPDATLEASAKPDLHQAEPLSILVVEDDPSLLRLYTSQMSKGPGKPHVVALDNAFAALIEIGRNGPDLLVLDLHLPGIDGFGILRVLRGTPETANTKIVVVTGLDELGRAAHGGLPLDVEVLPKPIAFNRLLEIAQGVAQSRRFRQPALR